MPHASVEVTWSFRSKVKPSNYTGECVSDILFTHEDWGLYPSIRL